MTAKFKMRGSNASLSFVGPGGATNAAFVRVSAASYTYGVNSTESHARLDRAFYPHRRALGKFTITIDAIGYKEYRALMNWLRLYASTLFQGQVGNQRGATPMTVYMPSRNLHKVGILTTGINDHDNTGSMVFSPTLTFMMLKDFSDPGTAIVSLGQTSQFIAPSVQNVETAASRGKGIHKITRTINDPSGTSAFYPVTVSSYKDQDSAIYDIPDGTVIPPGPGGWGGDPGGHGHVPEP